MKIAFDPTPLHASYELLDFPAVVAELGYSHMHLTPHPDVGPFFRHPKADSALLRKFRKALDAAEVSVPALLPVQRISWPEEDRRRAAVRNFLRIIQIAVDLEVPVINTEFSGRPERFEESEEAFHTSMETILPVIEKEGLRLNFDPHPDDFVEDGLEAWRILRSFDSDALGFVYVAPHTFHYGDRATTLIPELGNRLGAVYVSDTFDHTRSHGLRYITNPPGNAVRVHQHLRMGDGDVDFAELFSTLGSTGWLDSDEALIVSNVFAEDENHAEVAPLELERITALIDTHAQES